MKRLANALIVVGVGVVSLLVVYSLKVNSFTYIESAVILFLTGMLIILGILIKLIVNKNLISKDKLYSRLIIVVVYFTIITYNLIKIFI